MGTDYSGLLETSRDEIAFCFRVVTLLALIWGDCQCCSGTVLSGAECLNGALHGGN